MMIHGFKIIPFRKKNALKSQIDTNSFKKTVKKSGSLLALCLLLIIKKDKHYYLY